MAMQLTTGCHYFYRHNHVIAARTSLIAARRSSMVARGQPVFSISSKLSSSSRDSAEVVKGLDCLPNPKTPWLKLSSGIDPATGVVVDSFYSVAENQEVRLNRRDCLGVPETAICFASTGEWLAFVDPNDDCPLYLANPFFNDRDMSVIRLPSLATIPSCSGVERDPQTRSGTIFDMFVSPREVADELSIDSSVIAYSCDEMARKVRNLTISHLDPRHADCVAVALQGQNATLAYSRIWDDDRESNHLGWIGLQQDYYPFDLGNQAVFSHAYKMLYTINDNGIEVFDLFNDRKKRSKRVILFSDGDIDHWLKYEFEKEKKNKELKNLRNLSVFNKGKGRKGGHRTKFHLVALDDDNGKSSDLVLIARHRELMYGKTLHVDVFRVDFPTRSLERMKTLEERCVFVGADQSFSLCATKFPGLRPNSIYFINPFDHLRSRDRLVEDSGIFNLENNKIEPLEHPPKGGEKLFWISPSYIRSS